MSKNKDGFEPGQNLSFNDILAMRSKAGAVDTLPESPEDVDAMKKADVKAHLEAHEAETGGTVVEMRDRLKSVLFLEGL